MPSVLPPTPPELPPIRTMAEDLASATETPAPPTGAAPRPAGAAVLKDRSSALREIRGALPRAGGARPAGPQTIGLPTRAAKPRPSRALLIAAGLLALLLLAVGVWAVLSFRAPSGTPSLLGEIPSEVLAFAEIRGHDPAATAAREAAADVLGLPDRALFRDALRLRYLLLPGPSPTEPTPAVLLPGVTTADLTSAPALAAQRTKHGLLIVASTSLGRLRGLSGKTWATEPALRILQREIPEAASVVIAARPPGLAPLLQPLFGGVWSPARPVVLAFTPSGERVLRVVGHAGTGTPRGDATGAPPPAKEVAPPTPEGALATILWPAGTLQKIFARTPRVPESLQGTHRLLQQETESLGALLATAADGPLTLSTLVTGETGVRDFAVTIPLREGAEVLPILRTLEPAALTLAPFLTGGPFPDAAFAESEYQEVPIRYANFGSPNRSADYAVARSTLVLATSRGSMYRMLDVLSAVPEDALPAEGPPAGPPAEAPTVEIVLDTANTALTAEVPAAYRALLRAVDRLHLLLGTDGRLTGTAVPASVPVSEEAAETPAALGSPSPVPSEAG